MKAPIETIYVNPDIYTGEAGTSTIANVPMNTPIVSQETISNTPIFAPTTTSQTGGVKFTQLEAELQPVNVPVKSLSQIKSEEIAQNVVETIKAGQTPTSIVKTETTTTTATAKPTKKPNYLLYGGGALVIAYVVYKLLK